MDLTQLAANDTTSYQNHGFTSSTTATTDHRLVSTTTDSSYINSDQPQQPTETVVVDPVVDVNYGYDIILPHHGNDDVEEEEDGVPEIETAYSEARARGLPDGWTCSIDKRNRRKWTAPNHGRSCDSIPKAMAISVELGLLPFDTIIPTGNQKKKRDAGSSSGGNIDTTTSNLKKAGRPRKKKRLDDDDDRNKDRQQQEENDSADAAEALLSMVMSSTRPQTIKSGTPATTGEHNRDVASSVVRTTASVVVTVPSSSMNSAPASMIGKKSKTVEYSVKKEASDNDDDDDDDDNDDDNDGPPDLPMDPETSLDVYHTLPMDRKDTPLPNTVHWDPNDMNGRIVGWRVKVNHNNDTWIDGRVIRYDPYTHKHKVTYWTRTDQTFGEDDNENELVTKRKKSTWIWLRNEQHNLQLATQMVWAHVKGYAWWPALVMESNSTASKPKEGYVSIEFFGTGEVSCLRNTPESIRPFHPTNVDPIVAKHRKKRNERAFQLAAKEYAIIQSTRNMAAINYAKVALAMASYYAPKNSNVQMITGLHGTAMIGKRIQLFRSDVNYPYGDTVVAKVRQYSFHQKKWLLSFELSEKQSNRTKYTPTWLNIYGKEHAMKILDKNAVSSNEDMIPFLFGFDTSAVSNANIHHFDDSVTKYECIEIVDLLTTRCRGCVEYIKSGTIAASPNSPSVGTKSTTLEQAVTCTVCTGSFHLNCCDPPISMEQWQRSVKDDIPYTCARCTPCRGCYEKDIAFGSHPHPSPPTMLSLNQSCGAVLNLCSHCRQHYDAERFCPNCAHIWDHKKFRMVSRQIEYGPNGNGRRKKGYAKEVVLEDSDADFTFGAFDGDNDLPFQDDQLRPSYFYPETTQWGFTEDEMLVCDSCNTWVHAGCSGMTEEEYEITSNGDHPIYSKEYFCRMCCRKRCRELIETLLDEDRKSLFAKPVSDRIVPNYYDMIKEPMDLQTMMEKTEKDEYLNYAWVREMFELMVLNALTFNRYYTEIWREAKLFYESALTNVFAVTGSAAPAGKYEKRIMQCFKEAIQAQKSEEERIQIDETVELKDLVAGSATVVLLSLPKLRDTPPDLPSCVPFKEFKLKPLDAFYCSWMDCCFTCGSSGAPDTFLFCVDCGEAFHTFCVSAPIHSMAPTSVAGWRCPNCKICEISGDVPNDETRMLYCEMCDRGFSLDLVDPPLKSAPSGLWICGQCVDCKTCNNTSEKDGISLKYWSQNPEKCYRCGGCDGYDQDSKLQCQVCSGRLRSDDEDIVNCHRCDSNVHVLCDARAQEYLTREALASRSQKVQKTTTEEYLCPACYQPSKEEIESKIDINFRDFFSSQARQLITEDMVGPHDNFSDDELHQKLVEEVDWETRMQWQDEYTAIIRDAIGLYSMAQTVGDPRFVIQQVLQRMHQLPNWLGHRAHRFAVLVKNKRWDVDGFAKTRADVIIITAKLAAAFIDIVSRTLGIIKEQDVSFSNRLADLVIGPGDNGDFNCPLDRIKQSNSTIPFDNVGISLEIDKEGKRIADDLSSALKTMTKNARTLPYTCKIAKPLCGWGSEVITPSGITVWNDPRECCLCHICGDSDAGVADDTPAEDLSGLGRMLPLADGYWVHTSCALWSSEVWEAADDGMIHAVEKARSRGTQLKCFGCGFSGATVGCNKSNCPYNYHLPCARVCGAVFTPNQQVFCATHKSSAPDVLQKESWEHMKTSIVAPEKHKSISGSETPDVTESDLCIRVGSLVVHSFGIIETNVDGFHSENYVMPNGFVSSRIFWSSKNPRSRTAYILKIDRTADGQAEYTIIPGDDPTARITNSSASLAYTSLMERVRRVNATYFSQGDMLSKLPVVRRTRRKTYGLNGPQFFGFGLNPVRRILEASPGIEAVAAPISSASPQYKFCFTYGTGGTDPTILENLIRDVQRKRAATKSEQATYSDSGCARTEGIKGVVRSGGSGRITRALVRSAADDTSTAVAKKGDDNKVVADRSLVQVKYRKMKSIPIEQRLVARRSHIHGWGLFTKTEISKHDPVAEYMGEIIRQQVADKREKAYELSGEGSCFMFRLDMNRIIDATKIGCMARFMNHSCQPNAYAQILNIDTDLGQERKIVVFANRDIASGEEITYDYQFPVEDGSLRCTCGAPNCIGRLN